MLRERAEILQQVMVDVGMTQAKLAELSGVKQPSLSQMMHKRIDLSDEMLDRLLSCMGHRLEVTRRSVRVELDRSSERRWRLHERLALELSPESWQVWRPVAVENLHRFRGSTRGQPHLRNLDRWAALVAADDLRAIRQVMTSISIDSIQMREVSPLGGILAESKRQEVLSAVNK